jgi:hypothetical protein
VIRLANPKRQTEIVSLFKLRRFMLGPGLRAACCRFRRNSLLSGGAKDERDQTETLGFQIVAAQKKGRSPSNHGFRLI